MFNEYSLTLTAFYYLIQLNLWLDVLCIVSLMSVCLKISRNKSYKISGNTKLSLLMDYSLKNVDIILLLSY